MKWYLGKCIAAHHIYHYGQKCGYKADKHRIEKRYMPKWPSAMAFVSYPETDSSPAGWAARKTARRPLLKEEQITRLRHQKQKGSKPERKDPIEPSVQISCFSLHLLTSLIQFELNNRKQRQDKKQRHGHCTGIAHLILFETRSPGSSGTMNFVAPAGPPWVREYTRGYVLMIDTVDKNQHQKAGGFQQGEA